MFLSVTMPHSGDSADELVLLSCAQSQRSKIVWPDNEKGEFKEYDMDEQKQEDKRAASVSGGLRPYIVYRNPEGYSIREAFNQAVKEQRAKGLTVFRCDRKSE